MVNSVTMQCTNIKQSYNNNSWKYHASIAYVAIFVQNNNVVCLPPSIINIVIIMHIIIDIFNFGGNSHVQSYTSPTLSLLCLLKIINYKIIIIFSKICTYTVCTIKLGSATTQCFESVSDFFL